MPDFRKHLDGPLRLKIAVGAAILAISTSFLGAFVSAHVDEFQSKVTLKYNKKTQQFSGKVTSKNDGKELFACQANRSVEVFKRANPDAKIGATQQTNSKGIYGPLNNTGGPGFYYAEVKPRDQNGYGATIDDGYGYGYNYDGHRHRCLGATSKDKKVK